MDKDTAIRVNHVYKDFKLPHEKVNSIKTLFTGLHKKRTKSYEVQHALMDITFEVKKGEFFGIVGRNGSGKSTLLKILAEIYQPTKGAVEVSGKLVPFIELGVGFNPELTGRENVYLNGALLGFTKKEIDEIYDDIVSFAELEPFMDQKLKNYSSGMQVRLAFSVATRAKADILLIDEVLAVGDADFQRKCFNYFKNLKRSGTTVVFVSHDMDAVREYCSRALLIEDSEIIEVGDPDTVAQEYTKLFMNTTIPEGRLEQQAGRWGSSQIVTDRLSVETTGNVITIYQHIKAQELTDNPIAGIRIRSVSGESVTGTNTKIEKINIGEFRHGQKATIVWTLPAILAQGDYFIEPALVSRDGTTVYDWWDEAVVLSIKKERNLPYYIDPGFSISIKD